MISFLIPAYKLNCKKTLPNVSTYTPVYTIINCKNYVICVKIIANNVGNIVPRYQYSLWSGKSWLVGIQKTQRHVQILYSILIGSTCKVDN